jgi:hypothetical protein
LAEDRELVNRSYNPWRFPGGIRDRILGPVREAKVAPSLTCDAPLVDAVELRCGPGILIALANHTLRPIDRLSLQLKCAKPVARVESVRLGPIAFEQFEAGAVQFSLPLAASDFVKVWTTGGPPHSR